MPLHAADCQLWSYATMQDALAYRENDAVLAKVILQLVELDAMCPTRAHMRWGGRRTRLTQLADVGDERLLEGNADGHASVKEIKDVLQLEHRLGCQLDAQRVLKSQPHLQQQPHYHLHCSDHCCLRPSPTNRIDGQPHPITLMLRTLPPHLQCVTTAHHGADASGLKVPLRTQARIECLPSARSRRPQPSAPHDLHL